MKPPTFILIFNTVKCKSNYQIELLRLTNDTQSVYMQHWERRKREMRNTEFVQIICYDIEWLVNKQIKHNIYVRNWLNFWTCVGNFQH
jgi:hypothetical protein